MKIVYSYYYGYYFFSSCNTRGIFPILTMGFVLLSSFDRFMLFKLFCKVSNTLFLLLLIVSEVVIKLIFTND